MIFNVERGVFRSFSTRHQFYTFTKLKSYVTFPFFLQLFLFFSTFSLLSLALSDSICSRSNLVFSDWQHDTYTVGGPTYNGWQIFPFFAQNPSERTEKMPLFRKEYIYDTIQSQWIDISCFDLACIAFQWVVNYIDKNILFGQNVNQTKIKKDWVFVQNLMHTKRNVQSLFF